MALLRMEVILNGMLGLASSVKDRWGGGVHDAEDGDVSSGWLATIALEPWDWMLRGDCVRGAREKAVVRCLCIWRESWSVTSAA